MPLCNILCLYFLLNAISFSTGRHSVQNTGSASCSFSLSLFILVVQCDCKVKVKYKITPNKWIVNQTKGWAH